VSRNSLGPRNNSVSVAQAKTGGFMFNQRSGTVSSTLVPDEVDPGKTIDLSFLPNVVSHQSKGSGSARKPIVMPHLVNKF